MKAKQKALELRDKMKSCLFSDGLQDAKQCALIAVDELIEYSSQLEPFLGVEWFIEVKSELEKL